jgi:hypothetical protein
MMALGVLHMQVSAGLVTLALEAPAILVLAEAGYNAQRFADKSVPFCEAGKSIQIINYLSDWIYPYLQSCRSSPVSKSVELK